MIFKVILLFLISSNFNLQLIHDHPFLLQPTRLLPFNPSYLMVYFVLSHKLTNGIYFFSYYELLVLLLPDTFFSSLLMYFSSLLTFISSDA